jgi:hypothetical protein
MRYIYSYLISFFIGILSFLMLYYNILNNYADGFFLDRMWDDILIDRVVFPFLIYIALILLIFNFAILLPLNWVSTSKLKLDKIKSLLLFLFVSFFSSGIFLFSIEPIIATDYFEYGERQELNKVLETIGYGFFNTLIYISVLIISAVSWFVLSYKKVNL